MHKLVSPPDPPLCELCHQQGRGCCVAPADGAQSMFGLTRGEVAFISQVTGLKPEQFSVADLVSPEFLAFVGSIHPVFLQTMPEGRRRRLLLKEDNSCCFLGPAGCGLPTPARPLYCRLYPFWFNQYGRLMVLMNEKCLAQEGARSWRQVLKRLGQDEDHLRRLFADLQELAAEHEAGGGRIW